MRDKNICKRCMFLKAPYINKLGVYSPCVSCDNNNKYKLNPYIRKKDNEPLLSREVEHKK